MLVGNAISSTTSGRLPDFLIGGAQKSGSTALHVLLGSHSEVFLARPQELDFFDRNDAYARGITWYRAHFQGAAGHRAVGQTSTQYLYSSEAAERIRQHLPAAKLIFILRDPVDRAWSHYWHCVKYGLETADFAGARRLESERLARGGDHRRWFSYLDRGLYAAQLERYLKHFPRERILVLLTEELASGTGRALERCWRFLDVGPPATDLPPDLLARRWNSSRRPRWPALQRWTAGFRFRSRSGRRLASIVDRWNLVRWRYPALAPEDRRQLTSFFAAHNRRLAESFDLDLSAWS